MLNKARFKPGVHREGTQYSDGDPLTYYDADKVRFRKGRAKQIGGWDEYGTTVQFPVDEYTSGSPDGEETTTFRGVPRSIFDWVTSTGYKHLGLGTNTKFYIEYGNLLFDITPLRDTTSAGDVTFAATDSSSTIVVTDTAHGAVKGDYVKFSGAASLGGNVTADVLNHEYEIDAVGDTSGADPADKYRITARNVNQTIVTANASDTGDGDANVVGAYQINTGTNVYVPSLGWGSGPWGGGAWGGSGTIGFAQQLRLWSQTEFGDDLIFNPRGGGIYYWDQSDDWSNSAPGDIYATRAVSLPDATGAKDGPTVALQVMLSSVDKHVIVFGTNTIGSSDLDPLFLRWSDQESAVDWTPTSINSAGGQLLSSGNFIVGAIQTRQEILIFTDTSIHAMRFVGGDFIFQFSVISESVSMVSPNAGVAVGDSVFFMHKEGFYVYRGAIERLRCSVLSYVFDNIDKTQMFKVFAWHNVDDSEVWWFYPDNTQSPGEINRYVIYNYQDDNWSIGSFARGSWAQAQSRTSPLAGTVNVANVNENNLYSQEFGYSADGDDIAPFIETGSIEISTPELGDGERFGFLKRLIPDFRYEGNATQADLTLTIKKRNFPQDDFTTDSTHNVVSTTKQVHTRTRAREIALRWDGAGTGYGWTMGDHRLDIRTDGKK